MAVAPARVTDQDRDTIRPSGGGMVGQVLSIVPGESDKPTVLKASDGTVMRIRADGSGVDVGGEAEPEANPDARDTGFSENLAEIIDQMHLGAIGADVIEGVEADDQTRQSWISTYNDGMDLLGLKLEKNSMDSGTYSSVRHPVLLEAVIRGQSLARAELLPAAGPCKVRNDAEDSQATIDLAKALEQDFNHFLTVTATEYYPDTDRGLFYLYYGGVIYKKGYNCPIRRRPVSECVYAPDLIVSNTETDLQNALRVTHVIPMSAKRVKQLQLVGLYRDIQLTSPAQAPSRTKEKVAELSGVQARPSRPQDQDRQILECYTDLDLSRFGHIEEGSPDGLPLPYRVSIDKDDRQVLEIRRDWREGDKEFTRRRHFVKWGLIPGLGFLDYGMVHILGNTARTLTAGWRMLIDAGMYASFPGGVKLKSRSSPNEIKPPPGTFADVDGSDDIRKTIMPFPYKEPSPTLMKMIETVGADAQRLGNQIQIETGEGRTNIPVGTMMSLIETQTQNMAAIHKRLHTAQQEEFLMLKELFAEDPEALWRGNPQPARQWQSPGEFKDARLVPASDPNIPAQVHRIMQATALSMLDQQNPGVYKKAAIQKRILSTINVGQVEEILNSDEDILNFQARVAAMAQTPGQAQPKQGAAPDPAKAITAQAKVQDVSQRAQQASVEAQQHEQDNEARLQEIQAESADRAADRASRERIAIIKEE
ncbi:MAG: hypothetical protein ACREQ5_06780, partial [Candidatus Dormibacteria bacterium]